MQQMLALSAFCCLALGAADTTVEIRTDPDAFGHTFDGVGGLSAGATTRLLVDYPPLQQGYVLDYLFKPHFGAALQVLKIEIGGTGDSTSGTEDSHERSRGDINMTRGYELWFAQQALARNPDIVLYALAWTFPLWVEAAPEGFGSAAVSYLVDWVVGFEASAAVPPHRRYKRASPQATVGRNLTYLGFHNESPWQPSWVMELREELNRRGKHHVKIAVADCGPGPGFQTPNLVEWLRNDKALSATADVVGLHYPNSILPARLAPEYYRNLSTLPGQQKVWSSEEFSTPATASGARCLAKLLNRNYVDGNLTSSIVWSILYAWYPALACSGQGLIWAPEPWSGKIGVVDTVWVAAHTTQFTEVGWQYIRHGKGSGYLPPAASSNITARTVTMQPCGNGTTPNLKTQVWTWNSVSTAANNNRLHTGAKEAASRSDSGGRSRFASFVAADVGTGTISNAQGRCLTLNPNDGRIQSDACIPGGDPSQQFRRYASSNPALVGHIESVERPGNCLDMNAAAEPPIVDTYACCCAGCCCDCESWKFVANEDGDAQYGGRHQQHAGVSSSGISDKNSTNRLESGAMVSLENMMCVTDGQAATVGGSGSFVTLVNPSIAASTVNRDGTAREPESEPNRTTASPWNDVEFATIIETMDNDHSSCAYGNAGWEDIIVDPDPNPVTFCFPDLYRIAVNKSRLCTDLQLTLWQSIMTPLSRTNGTFEEAATTSSMFQQVSPPPQADQKCCISLELQPNAIYTLSTRTSATKGSHPIASISPVEPQAASCGSVAAWTGGTPFPIPYATEFASPNVKFRDFAEYFSDMQGIFRVIESTFPTMLAPTDGDNGNNGIAASNNVLSQFVFAADPDSWAGLGGGVPPTTLIGSNTWTDYRVTATGRLAPNATGPENIAVTVRQGHNYAFGSIGGFRFALYANCTWQLTAVGAAVPLAVGKVKAASTNPTAGWQELSLAVAGTKLTAAINNATVAVANSSAWADGYAGLSTGWHQAWFSTFEIQRA